MIPGEWRRDALCRETDPEMFYPNYTGGRARESEEAKRWCRACPVLDQCRAWVMEFEHGEPAGNRFGVWAGMTPRERARLERSGGTVPA